MPSGCPRKAQGWVLPHILTHLTNALLCGAFEGRRFLGGSFSLL
jgi:hypothetical protein